MNTLSPNWVITSIREVAEYISRGKSPQYIDHSELPVINQKAIRWSGIQTEYIVKKENLKS